MPSAQMIDFGPDPLTENMGKFASGFSDSFFKQQTQKKNEDIFQRIKRSYGPKANPDQVFREILESEGLDQDYKRDLLKEVKEYATLAAQKDKTIYQNTMQEIRQEELGLKKKAANEEKPLTAYQRLNLESQEKRLNLEQQRLDKEKPITAYQRRNLESQERRLDLEQQRIDLARDKGQKDLPELVSKYINNVLQGSEDKVPSSDKALLNQRTLANVEEGMSTNDAFQEALDYVDMKNQIVEEAEIEKRPQDGTFFNTTPQQMQQSFQKAYQHLNEVYEAGIESQRDLRTIAKRAGWKQEEITELLQAVYSSHGRKARTSKQSLPADKVTGSEQGMAQEVGGLDDILFGE